MCHLWHYPLPQGWLLTPSSGSRGIHGLCVRDDSDECGGSPWAKWDREYRPGPARNAPLVHNPPSRPGTQAGYPAAASPRCSWPGRPMVVLGFLEEEARRVLWVLITGHTGQPVMGSEEREGPLAAWVSRARYLVNRAKKGLPLWGVNIYFPLWASQRIRFGQSDGLNFLVDVK